LRKNNQNRTGFLSRLGWWKRAFLVEGLNQDNLLGILNKRGIKLYDVKKISNKKVYISVNLNQSEKFFAITKELCYNVKKVGVKGRHLWVYRLINNVGLAIGALFFAVIAYFSNDILFDYRFSGSGKAYKNQVIAYLNGVGLKKFARFSDFRLDLLEDRVLSSNPNLTFVSLEKKGNYLQVYLVLKNQSADRLNGEVYSLKSGAFGVVESVKVYRGTPVVKVGDTVKEGDILVDGFVVVKEQTVPVSVLAFVTLVCEHTTVYQGSTDGESGVAKAIADQELFEWEIIDQQVGLEQKQSEGETLYEYTVVSKYRRVFFAG